MLIKRENRSNWLSLVQYWQRGRHSRRIISGLILIAGLGLLFVYSVRLGVRLHASGQANTYFEMGQYLRQATTKPLITLNNYRRAHSVAVPRLDLSFKFEDWRTLENKHEEAMRLGTLYASDNPEVPVSISYHERSAKGKARLKGGLEHWNSDKWSWRIELKDSGDATIMGLKKFSLQHPKTRDFLSEWVMHRMLQREGLIGLRYQFVRVVINGQDKGIYALEQHFDKLVLEGAKRREGPIVYFSEDLYNGNYWPNTIWPNEVRKIDAYEESSLTSSPLLSEQLVLARSLIESLRAGELTTCQVFACDQLATYFALLDILGCQHAAGSGNMKMYYNPITARIEPIGFDGEADFSSDRPLLLQYWYNYRAMPDSVKWLRTIFSDDQFMAKYLRNLQRLTDRQYWQKFLDEEKADRQEQLDIIHLSYPTYEYDVNAVFKQQSIIKDILTTRQGINAYLLNANEQRVNITAGTILPYPVQVVGLRHRGVYYPINPKVKLDALKPNQSIAVSNVTAYVPDLDLSQPDSLELVYTPLGLEDKFYQVVWPLPKQKNDYLDTDLFRQQPTWRNFPWIKELSVDKQLLIPAGQWQIDRPLVIPADYTVVIKPGTTLDLVREGQLISYSPLVAVGTPAEPITIQSTDGLGRGVAVINTDTRPSRFEDVHWYGLAAPRYGSWRLSGAVTFYRSPVIIRRVTFSNNHDADDWLNLVNTDYQLTEVSFINAAADAFDSDFSSGWINKTQVFGAGNDGFDFSGGKSELKNIRVQGVSDKAISAGEETSLLINALTITNSHLGLVSKDKSSVNLNSGVFKNLRVAVALYQKKAEFGPAKARVNNVQLEAVDKQFMLEEGSTLWWDGKEYRGQAKSVVKQLE